MMNDTMLQAKKKLGTAAGTERAAGLVKQSGQNRSLPDAVRGKMETSLGMDFSHVRITESPMVGTLGMEAVTRGNEIAFDKGKFAPGSREGQELLGHELSHVASQFRGEARGSGLLEHSGLEQQADMQGAMAARGEHAMGALSPMSVGQAPAQGTAQMSKAARKTDKKINKQIAARPDKSRYQYPFDTKRGVYEGSACANPGALPGLADWDWINEWIGPGDC